MLWLRKKDVTEKKLIQMSHMVARSFSHVREDTNRIFQWLNYFYQRNKHQEQLITQLRTELAAMPRRPEDLKRIIEQHYSFDHILERIKILNEKVDAVASRQIQIPKPHSLHEPLTRAQPDKEQGQTLSGIQKRLTDLEEQRKATIREKVVQRVAKNSKDYVKSLVLSYIRKHGQISALQLKEMVVEDQGLCSKSSFYRLLEELEEHEAVGTLKEGKQKYYTFRLSKRV